MKKNEQNPNSKQRKGAFKKAAIIVGATGVMALNTACNNQCPQQPKMKNIQRTEKIVPQNNKKELSEYELEQLSDLRDILSNMLGQRNEEARKVYNELDKYYLGDYEYDYDKMPKDLTNAIFYQESFKNCKWKESDLTNVSGNGTIFSDNDFIISKLDNVDIAVVGSYIIKKIIITSIVILLIFNIGNLW